MSNIFSPPFFPPRTPTWSVHPPNTYRSNEENKHYLTSQVATEYATVSSFPHLDRYNICTKKHSQSPSTFPQYMKFDWCHWVATSHDLPIRFTRSLLCVVTCIYCHTWTFFSWGWTVKMTCMTITGWTTACDEVNNHVCLRQMITTQIHTSNTRWCRGETKRQTRKIKRRDFYVQ